eukprot:CAMPEP_0204895490 /NCGR_PEP_ID=MMETSP1349-20130617/34055_1 /ASSEMBLY_ACC=CAM_ASM_000710 /TAXON_ID=215587 /ORGANISM="Aplanochytrium stocchinoi, Strain GSBS06" /LENGTH=218 /DNA_ID=CAMNT_0052062875 /DNA_START=1649 /DNA_END=2305 /DNA_ORIENTATION=+
MRVYDDEEDPGFRSAFTRISGIEHHISTQTAFWIDAMGGGRAYHGGDYRLNVHHSHNAASVMNAQGAKRWMYHMGNALCDLNFSHIDVRIKPCLVDFLRTKMKKYAKEHGWRYDESDFDFVKRDPETVALRNMELSVLTPSEIERFSVKALKKLLDWHDKDYSMCREKDEMRALVKELLQERDLNVKNLKIFLSMHGKDYSACTEKEELRLLALEVFE